MAEPNIKTFPSDGWGNHIFNVYNTGETGYNGRGLYYATYSLNGDYLWQSYLIDPQYTMEEANTEGVGTSCPSVSSALEGTNGDQSSPGYSNATVLAIFTNADGGEWKNWTPTNIATTKLQNDPPYYVTTYSDDDAFDGANA